MTDPCCPHFGQTFPYVWELFIEMDQSATSKTTETAQNILAIVDTHKKRKNVRSASLLLRVIEMTDFGSPNLIKDIIIEGVQ
jgi:hypothetical protein